MRSWREINAERQQTRQDVSAFKSFMKTPVSGSFRLPANCELVVRALNPVEIGAQIASIGDRTLFTPVAMDVGATRRIGYFSRGLLVSLTNNFDLYIDQGLGVYKRIASGQLLLIGVPQGFGSTNGVNIYRSPDGAYSTDFDFVGHRPVTAATYWIDPVSGSDSNDGLSQGAPKLSLSAALTAANTINLATTFKVKPGVVRGTLGPNGVAVSLPAIVVEPWATDPSDPANRVIFIRKSTTTAFTWVADSGVYRRSTTTGADPTWVFDLLIRDTGSAVTSYPKATSLADCQATAGTWWRDSGTGNTYVHAADGRNLVGDPYIEFNATGTNMNLIPTQSMTVWMQNIEFGCGDNPFVCNFTTNTNLTMDVYLIRCGMFGGLTGNSAAYDADLSGCTIRLFQDRCWTGYSFLDGFNYHSQGSALGMFAFENQCYSAPTGKGTGLANNATTQHENCRTISLNGLYMGSQDRVMHDVTATKRWVVKSDIRASQGGTPATAMTVVSGHPDGSSNCVIWLDSCTIQNSATAGLYAYGAADRIYYANMSIAGLVTGGAGQIAAYVA